MPLWKPPLHECMMFLWIGFMSLELSFCSLFYAVSMVMGIPTVKRKVKSYLSETLHSLIDKLGGGEARLRHHSVRGRGEHSRGLRRCVCVWALRLALSSCVWRFISEGNAKPRSPRKQQCSNGLVTTGGKSILRTFCWLLFSFNRFVLHLHLMCWDHHCLCEWLNWVNSLSVVLLPPVEGLWAVHTENRGLDAFMMLSEGQSKSRHADIPGRFCLSLHLSPQCCYTSEHSGWGKLFLNLVSLKVENA